MQTRNLSDMIVRTLAFTLSIFLIGGIGMFASNRKMPVAKQRRQWTKLGVYFIIVHAMLAAAMLGSPFLELLFSLLFIVGALELRRALFPHQPLPSRVDRRHAFLFCAAYGVLAAVFLLFLAQVTRDEFIYVYLVVATFDGFSQVVGQLIGRQALAKRISPRKTVEGTLGGLIAGLAASFVLAPSSLQTAVPILFVGLALCSAALIGDLLASGVKRVCGIKDFGVLFPGHGGILDRFDSLIVAAPVFFFLILA